MALDSVIISGGGTGGHIFPALAIADAIRASNPNCKILFVGALGRMEMERVPKAGYEIVGLNIQGLQRSFSKENLKFPFKVIGSIVKSRKLIRERKPDLAIGVGGYASGPLLFAAAKKGVKTLIQEQNSYAGITNKMLGKRVDKVCLAYEEAASYFPKHKIELTGNPVRKELNAVIDKDVAKTALGFQTNAPVIFIVGGSLGAPAINKVFEEQVEQLLDSGCQVLWQTGKNYFQKNKQLIEDLGKKQGLKITQFVDNMAEAYAAADVVISRAGALAISELQMLAKAVVLVPSPYVAENHQYKNAMALVNKKAALLVEEKNIKNDLIATVLDLMKNTAMQSDLKKNIKQMELPNAAEKVVEIANQLVNG